MPVDVGHALETRAPTDLLEPIPDINPWAVSLTVVLATFMEVLDTSVANVALPHIAGSLSATIDESSWVLTSYLVSNAIVLPLAGWFSTLFGRKRFYMACVAVITVSSLLCGHQAQALLYGMVQREAAMKAFIDNFWMLGVIFLAIAPVMVLMKRTH